MYMYIPMHPLHQHDVDDDDDGEDDDEHDHEMYSDPANTMSLLMHCDAASILRYSEGLPITRAALRKSRQSSSSRVMQRTMLPSAVIVIAVMSAKGIPRAHSYTTALRPKFNAFPLLLLLSDEAAAAAALEVMPALSCRASRLADSCMICCFAMVMRLVNGVPSSDFSCTYHDEHDDNIMIMCLHTLFMMITEQSETSSIRIMFIIIVIIIFIISIIINVHKHRPETRVLRGWPRPQVD